MIITDIKELRKRSEEIKIRGIEPKPCEEVENIIKQLEEELAKHKTGVGLAAVQIGIQKRVAVVKIPGREKIILYNTKILEKSEPFKTVESCLSLPGLLIYTKRYKNITIENGDGQKYGVEGMEAIAIQHELDHWEGKLIIDRKWKKRGKR